ncbi:hypothetical protein V6N13_025338 [Hibiscus sabdariffa]
MNEINKTLPQLLGMLRTVEGDMKKSGSKSILEAREAKRKEKKVAKSKGVGKTKHKGKNVLKPKGGISKEGKCFHCEKSGHWKRNCPFYLEEVKKAKAFRASVSGIYVIDVNMSTSSSWVLDTGCGSHICTSVQGLHMRRNLAKGDVDLRVGNGARVAALAWNGVYERRNRTLLDMVRSMMSHSDLPISFWGHALETTTFTLNRVPSKSVQKTSYEIWTGKRPKTKGYYFFNPKENKVLVARTGVFLEKEFLLNKRDRRNIELKEVLQQQVTEPEVEQTSQVVEENSTNLETQPLRRSMRERHEPERYGFLVTTHGDVILVDQDKPKTYQEAMSSPDDNSGEKFVDRKIYLFDIGRVKLKKRMNAVHVRDQKHELTPPRNRANPRGLIYELDPEIERTRRELRQRARVIMQGNNSQNPIDGQEQPRQNPPAQAGRAIVPPIPQNNQQQPVRTVRDYLAKDLEGLNPAVTIPEFEVEHFELKPGFNNLLEQDDKGDVSTETTGPAPAEVSAGIQISAERRALLLAYP